MWHNSLVRMSVSLGLVWIALTIIGLTVGVLPARAVNVDSVLAKDQSVSVAVRHAARDVTDTTYYAYLPLVTKPLCLRHTAELQLTTPVTQIVVGQALTVQVTLSNTGCVALGLPQYTVWHDPYQGRAIFTPTTASVIHGLAIGLNESDSAEFVLQAIDAGQTVLRSSASFEVNTAYWGYEGSAPLTVTVSNLPVHP